MRVLATTTPGLEAVAASEVAELVGSDGERSARGRLRFETDPEGLARLNLYARTLNRTNVVLHESRFDSLDDVGRVVESLDWARYLRDGQAFAVRATRHGDHEFGSPDVARVVGQAVVDGYRDATGHRLPVDLDDPDVELRAFVRDDRFLLAVDATGPSLHARPWRTGDHGAAVRPTTAAALVRLAGHEPHETLSDPMAGSGTIPVEAALAARGRPVDPTRETTIEADRVVFDPPYGHRMDGGGLRSLYADTFRSLDRGSWRSVVLLTTREDLVPWTPDDRVEVRLGRLEAAALRFESR